MARPPTRAHTAPEPSLEHDAEALERPTRARTAPVAWHTEPTRDNMGDTPMAEGSKAPGTVGCAESGGSHVECHCEQVSFLIGKYPKMGMDAIVQHLDRLDNAKKGLEEDIAGILDDQSAAERDLAELRAEQDRYREKLEMALQKQPPVVDSLLHLVEDMSGRLKRLEELQPLASGPELPARPATAELVERVKTLRSAMDKPMGGPAEAPYAPPRVDPGALPFVPMFSESIMLGEHTAPAGSMREEHATTDLRSLTVQMSHAAQDPPTTTTAHAVYAEEEIQHQTMQGRTMERADGHGRGHPGRNLWVKDPTTGIWTAGGASPSRIPNPMGSGPTGPHSMEERDVRGVYSHPPATGGIRLGGVVAADVGDAIRIDDLRRIKIPYYDGNPSNLDDFILDWEDFAEEVVSEMKGAPRDKLVCGTFPHRLAQPEPEPEHWCTTPATVTPTPLRIPQGEAPCASGSSRESGGPAPGHQVDTSLPPRKNRAWPPQPHARAHNADPDSPPSGRAVGGRGAQDPERPTQRSKAPPRGRPAAAPTTPSQVGGNRDRTAPPQAHQTEHGTGAGHAEGHGPHGTALPAPSAGTTRDARATPPSGERTPRERERTHTKRTRGDHQKGNRTERAERTDRMEWRTSERE